MTSRAVDSARETPVRRASHDNVRTITRDTFQPLVLAGEGPIAVEFMSYGCAYCRELEPIVQDVAELLRPTEALFRVNTGADPELASSYEIRGTPTFVMFLNGREVGRVAGPHPTARSVLAAVTSPFEQ
jgi:thioredoxin 1